MFFEREEGGNRAVLVHIDLPDELKREDSAEFLELVRSAGAEVLVLIGGSRKSPSARLFVGDGKLEEIRAAVEEYQADLVLFNHSLKPSQERNLEKELGCRILDRTGLILDIFAQRARTYEGKLQVELAQLEFLTTRLVRGRTYLQSQKGGIGLRGPGETQLETDRRLVRKRVEAIQSRLKKVRVQRETSRRARVQAEIPAVSLVGYTNAGKSTLFNRLTNADVYTADQLFATLDPTLRRIELEDVGTVVLIDTVGFIRHLPHKLIEAFQATLQEAAEATLLIHLVDAASHERDDNIDQVEQVLDEVGAAEVPTLMVFNKIDRLEQQPRIERDANGVPKRVWLSAATGEGCDLLLQAINERLAIKIVKGLLQLHPAQTRLRAGLFNLNAVTVENYSEEGHCQLQLRLPQKDFRQLLSQLNLAEESLLWITKP
ncbi:MAG TPA: ribosome rescue GTPase HflX [Marinospirillum sp.]|uniref:ribosome rescue GTPase HflX n=1 Tax=Marinospirillum sp. TaxID=2183934 RepID=UPI002B4946FE|nr:ribosome rescue GTPase HflX [Marinospirillum sp.]HKM16524.1 ribosome rescue GTPase HflX [Marinospirillum sp.]